MSLDLFDPLPALQNAQANLAPDLPAGFHEAFDVSTRAMTEWNSSVADANARERALATFYDDVKAQTGVQLPLYGMGGNVSLEELNDAITKLPQPLESAGQSWRPLSESDINAMALARMRKAHDDAAAFSKRETTWGGTFGSITGTLAAGVSDPVTLATLPLGGAGQAGIAFRALEFALIGAGTEAAIAAAGASSREAAVPGSLREIPGEIASAALFGGIFGAGIGGLQKLAGTGARTLPVTVRDEVHAATSEAQLNLTNPFPTAAGEAAARDAAVEATRSAVRGEPVRVGDDFSPSHVADYALAAEARTPEELSIAGEKHLRPETYGLDPEVERFDRMPTETDDVVSYWEKRLEGASAEERTALGATDAEQIRSAAIRFDGNIYQGALHSDAYKAAAAATGRDFSEVIGKTKPQDSGFVTNTGRYVDREEAARIANLAEQTTHRVDELAAEHLPEGYFGRPAAIEPTARDLSPEQMTALAADPATDEAVLRNLDRIRLDQPEAEFVTQVKQPDGSYQFVSRKLEDVLDELDGMETLGKELEACATGMMAAE
ncbi:hypothetical protein JQ599_09720 [Bradyrhizobium diazoefficiens]|nr:hypothetical protein [Bradyrhizobium diazoefficiens]MBR0700177.1 hypothetical protein [Bradyrhizobium diazoefficiens]MBR0768512.1 hypothetical protein [Bradyrhizobium diazoefficiens]